MKIHDFVVFLELWNMKQGYITPSIHYRMAAWLQTSWERGDTRLLLMAFRASGKSTLVGLFSAWLLWRDPECRILVLAAELSLARKMVRNIKKTIEKHPLTAHLKPNNPDQWASDSFTVNRNIELRDPSVLAAGVTANITGSRANVIIYDDVEVPNTCDTAEKRDALRERLGESNFILTPKGTQFYVGTPHTYFSIYAKEPRLEVGEGEAGDVFLSGYKRYEQPLLDSCGRSVWPEHFSDDDVALLKRQSGPNKFFSQMMLEPVNITDGRLDVDLLMHYDGALEYHEAQQKIQLSLNGHKLVSCNAWWDPAFGSADKKKKRDSSVLAVVFTDEEGQQYLHHISYLLVNCKEGEDEATLQCQKVADILEKLFVPSVTVETNGIGMFLPAILRRELGVKNIPCAVIDKASRRPKNIRILEAFDAVMAARALYVHKDVGETPFLREMMEWQPKRKGGNDDGLDAVAGALSLEPVRLKRVYSTMQTGWHKGSQSYQARSDFEV